MLLKDKVALITGSSSGIGRATALLFAKEGAKIAVHGRNDDKIAAVVEEIKKAGGEAMGVPADLAQPKEVEDAIAKIDSKWGRLDIVMANAGVNGVWAPLDDLSVDEFMKTMTINLAGSFASIKYAYPLLKRQGGAVIITSSVNGTRIFSNSGATAYSCSKAGQVAMGRMLALELAKDRIRVNTICPGAIETNIDENTEARNVEEAKEPVEFPEGPIPLTDGAPGSSEDVARLALFLASDASSHITGAEVFIDGAQSLLQG